MKANSYTIWAESHLSLKVKCIIQKMKSLPFKLHSFLIFEVHNDE